MRALSIAFGMVALASSASLPALGQDGGSPPEQETISGWVSVVIGPDGEVAKQIAGPFFGDDALGRTAWQQAADASTEYHRTHPTGGLAVEKEMTYVAPRRRGGGSPRAPDPIAGGRITLPDLRIIDPGPAANGEANPDSVAGRSGVIEVDGGTLTVSFDESNGVTFSSPTTTTRGTWSQTRTGLSLRTSGFTYAGTVRGDEVSGKRKARRAGAEVQSWKLTLTPRLGADVPGTRSESSETPSVESSADGAWLVGTWEIVNVGDEVTQRTTLTVREDGTAVRESVYSFAAPRNGGLRQKDSVSVYEFSWTRDGDAFAFESTGEVYPNGNHVSGDPKWNFGSGSV